MTAEQRKVLSVFFRLFRVVRVHFSPQLCPLINQLISIPGDDPLTRIIHEASTAAADPGMSAALRSFGLLGVLLSTPAGPSVALAEMRQMRLVSMPVCASSLRTFMNNAG